MVAVIVGLVVVSLVWLARELMNAPLIDEEE